MACVNLPQCALDPLNGSSQPEKSKSCEVACVLRETFVADVSGYDSIHSLQSA